VAIDLRLRLQPDRCHEETGGARVNPGHEKFRIDQSAVTEKDEKGRERTCVSP
jgi:hypothetical protein